MKYILLKYGSIYEVKEEEKQGFICKGKLPSHSDLYVFKDTSFKQADTIEELCDEILVKIGNHKPIFTKEMNELYLMDLACRIEDEKEKGNTVDTYGAIWTDKGLIYVAKMNDKGELELI